MSYLYQRDPDSPQRHENLVHYNAEAVDLVRSWVARLRAIWGIEWERDEIALRLAVLEDRCNGIFVTSEAIEYNDLMNRLVELDSEHAELTGLDYIEP